MFYLFCETTLMFSTHLLLENVKFGHFITRREFVKCFSGLTLSVTLSVFPRNPRRYVYYIYKVG